MNYLTMAIEISLVYLLTESCSGAHIFFSWLLFIYLNCTDYLMNRRQYLDFDKFLTGINLPPPHPAPKKFFITSRNSLYMSV